MMIRVISVWTFSTCKRTKLPILGAARSKTDRLLGLCVRIPPGGGHGCVFVVNVVCCQVEVSTLG